MGIESVSESRRVRYDGRLRANCRDIQVIGEGELQEKIGNLRGLVFNGFLKPTGWCFA